METIAVHAHLLDLTEQNGVVAPDQWYHDVTAGSLTYRFGSGPNTFTWRAPDIASIVAKINGEPSTGRARDLIDRWDAISDLLDRTGRAKPDRLLVDHTSDEMTLTWRRSQSVLVFGPDDAGDPDPCYKGPGPQ